MSRARAIATLGVVIRAVLFDLDDTLIDHASAAHAAVLGWAAERGLTGAPEELTARWTAISDRHYARYQAREMTFGEQRRERARDFLGTELSDAGADAAFAGYLTRYEAGWSAFPDARAAVERVLAAGLVGGILTNGDAAHQAVKLKRVGLDDLGLRFFATSDFPAGKPDPRPFLGACSAMGVRPAETLMVGNSLEHDFHGARGAGLGAVLLDRFDTHLDIPERIRSLDELSVSG